MQKRFILDCVKELIVYKKNMLCQTPILTDCSGRHPQSCRQRVYVSKICFNYINWLVVSLPSKFVIFHLQPPLHILSNESVLICTSIKMPHFIHILLLSLVNFSSKPIIICFHISPSVHPLLCSCHLQLQHLQFSQEQPRTKASLPYKNQPQLQRAVLSL